MKNAIKNKADIINDVSCFKFDKEIYKELKIKIYGKYSSYARNTTNNAN